MRKEEKPLYPPSLPFHINGYTFESVLGSGSFSTVYKALHQSSKGYFAAKVMNLAQKTKLDVIGAEVGSLLNLYHQNIVKIYETFTADNHFFMIIELCNGKTMGRIISEDGALPYYNLISYIRQILNAISYCHEKKIAHRDIKPENIFVEPDGRCIIGDFGLSCIEKEKTTDFCGSLIYKAPEILLKKEYNPLMADIWSLGVTFYTMAVGSIPWKPSEYMSMEKCIVSCDYYIPPLVNREVILLIKSMLILDPNRRKTTNELLENPIFSSRSSVRLYPLNQSSIPRIPLCIRSSSAQKKNIVVPKTRKRNASLISTKNEKPLPIPIIICNSND
jgi:serine/threonine protein kinase